MFYFLTSFYFSFFPFIISFLSSLYPKRRRSLFTSFALQLVTCNLRPATGLFTKLLYCYVAILLFLLPRPAHSAQVTLQWDPNSESELAGYKVYVGIASGDYQYFIDVGNKTTFTVPNLRDGETYYFAATAYDSSDFESNFSNELAYNVPAPCRYSLSSSSQSFNSSGGTGTVAVTTQSTCTWTATSNASWLMITSNSTNTGNRTVYYSVLANPDASSRTGILDVAGKTFTVTQEGITPKYTITAKAGPNGSISPQGSITVSHGGNQNFTITPNLGYRVEDVKVDGISIGVVGSYSFSNLSSNHTIEARFIAIDARNLLANGDFESGNLTNWEYGRGTYVASQSAYSGNFGAKMTDKGSIAQRFHTTPSKTYHISAKIRIDRQIKAPRRGGLVVEIWDDANHGKSRKLAAGPYLTTQNSPEGQWTEINFSFVATSMQSKIFFKIFSNGRFEASADDFIIIP